MVVVSAAPADPAYQEQMREAIRRHDGGDFAGAITIYRSLLKDYPHEPNVVFELSLSMQAGNSPPAEQIEFIEAELKSKVVQLPQLYATLAAAYDTKGDLAKGEATLRKGLKVGAKSADLHFNLGINLIMQHRSKDAEAPLKTAVQLKPDWPSAWRALAQALEDNHKLLEAFLVKARFVALEPGSPRGRRAAQTLWPLLMTGVEKKPGKDGKERIDVNMGNTEDLMMSLTAATRYTKEKLSDGEFFVSALRDLVAYTTEEKNRPFLREAASLFIEAKEGAVLDALCWELRRAADDPNADTWFATHRKESARLDEFMRSRRR